MTYEKIEEKEIPEKVRFDVPRRLAGQIVEVAYGGFDRGEHDQGAPYQRVTDQHLPPNDPKRVTYWRRRP